MAADVSLQMSTLGRSNKADVSTLGCEFLRPTQTVILNLVQDLPR
jgi:hypothetical protein